MAAVMSANDPKRTSDRPAALGVLARALPFVVLAVTRAGCILLHVRSAFGPVPNAGHYPEFRSDGRKNKRPNHR